MATATAAMQASPQATEAPAALLQAVAAATLAATAMLTTQTLKMAAILILQVHQVAADLASVRMQAAGVVVTLLSLSPLHSSASSGSNKKCAGPLVQD